MSPVGLTNPETCRCCGRGPVYMVTAFDSHIGERLCNECIESTLFNFIFRFGFPMKRARHTTCAFGKWQNFDFQSQTQEASIE